MSNGSTALRIVVDVITGMLVVACALIFSLAVLCAAFGEWSNFLPFAWLAIKLGAGFGAGIGALKGWAEL